VALLGPSGTGKSTMLQAVGRREGGFGGRSEIAGIDATDLASGDRTALRRDHLGFVYQFHHLLPDFSAEENVMLPQLVAGVARNEALQRARELLGSLGLDHRLTHRPSQLSGGEQDRKSTRLNSSHVKISYAVFCLKKKNDTPDRGTVDRA